MRFPILALPLAVLPALCMADPLEVQNAVVPLTPPTAMAHAAYMKLQNVSGSEVELIGASADGYAMTHLHLSEDKNGVATMTAVDAIAFAPEQKVLFAPGGLHIMLMRPENTLEEGATIDISLLFSDGTEQAVVAKVVPRDAVEDMLHDHGS